MANSRKDVLHAKKLDQLRQACLSDLYTFAALVNPERVYGEIHKELFRWLQFSKRANRLVLLPRGHQKSHCAATLAAWLITQNPAVTVLYISATSYLAEQQIRAIKHILTNPMYQQLWPSMIHPEESKREKWTSSEICVDHPIRKNEGIRDSTVFSAGLTTNIVGLHADIIIKDDVVVPDNVDTFEGRRKVETQCSLLASIANPDSTKYTFGTRYHPSDHYQSLLEMQEIIFDDDLNPIGEEEVYDVFERVVEIEGDFVWPRTCRPDGKWFGFDVRLLARIKAEYIDSAQFFSQYYNNPNAIENRRLDESKFVYYEKKYLNVDGYLTSFRDDRLNVTAAIDLAFTVNKKSDYTAIVVIGVNSEGIVYVLDMERYKTRNINDHVDAIIHLHKKWHFRKLRAEANGPQKATVEYLKDELRKAGASIVIDEHRYITVRGNKVERILATIEARYDNQAVFHYKGGLTPVLEDEILLPNPRHDDLKDALASAIEICKPPVKVRNTALNDSCLQYHPRFGGVVY